MIAQRLRGLLNLHTMVAGGAVVLWLFLLAAVALEREVAGFQLSAQVRLLPYAVGLGAGIALSSRFLNKLAMRYHRITWFDAAWLSTRQVLLMAAIVFALMFVLHDRAVSRKFLVVYMVTSWMLLWGLNMTLPLFLSKLLFGPGRKVPTLFIGSVRALNRLHHWLTSKALVGLQPVGFLSDEDQPSQEVFPPWLGEVVTLKECIRQHRVVQVIMVDLPATHLEGRWIVEICQHLGCRLLIHNNLEDIFQHPLTTVTEEGLHFQSLQNEPLEDPLNRMLKRVLDIAIALPVVTLLLPPLCLWVWVMQKRQSPGPLFFCQERTGHGQSSFLMYKFRTMRHEEKDAETEAKQATAGDARIFPFGRFLRKMSLDEFPQFINVLRGNMSVVGPRPHLPLHDREFSQVAKPYHTRFFVKPGVTGLAQCRGFRGEIVDPEMLHSRVESDLAYITQWSIWLDCQIIVRTAWQVIFPPKTAY